MTEILPGLALEGDAVRGEDPESEKLSPAPCRVDVPLLRVDGEPQAL